MLNTAATWLRKLGPKEGFFGVLGLFAGGMMVAFGYFLMMLFSIKF